MQRVDQEVYQQVKYIIMEPIQLKQTHLQEQDIMHQVVQNGEHLQVEELNLVQIKHMLQTH